MAGEVQVYDGDGLTDLERAAAAALREAFEKREAEKLQPRQMKVRFSKEAIEDLTSTANIDIDDILKEMGVTRPSEVRDWRKLKKDCLT